MIRSFDGTEPRIADSAYVDPAAVVVGDVTVAAGASVWPNAVLRGDDAPIRVGERANVQDNATLHGAAVVEDEGAVAHGAVVHDATVGEAALVGINAVVLDGAEVGPRAIVAAGSVLTEDTVVPEATLVAGAPAQPRKELSGEETAARADHYAALAERHRRTSTPVDRPADDGG